MLGRRGEILVATCEYPPFPGGIGTYAGALVQTLDRAGHKVTVIGPRYADHEDVNGSAVEHIALLGHHSIPLGAPFRMLSLIRKTSKDSILLAADIRTLLLLYLLQPLHRRRYRVMVHGSEVSKFKTGSVLFRLVRRAYLHAELVAYNSAATRAIFRTGIGAPQNDIVAYLGVDAHWFERAPDGFEHFSLSHLPPDRPLFCSVGRIERRKGQLEAVLALAHARDVFGLPAPIYVIAGHSEDDSYVEAIQREADRLSIETIFTGRLSIDDLKRLYQRSAANLLLAQPLPGKVEGFGLVLLEAAARGCPSIGSAVGGIPEVIGDAGTLVVHNNKLDHAQAIAKYARHVGFRQQMSDAAIKRARQFSWQACAAATFPELSFR